MSKIPVHLDTSDYFRIRAVLKREFPDPDDPHYTQDVVVEVSKTRSDGVWLPASLSTWSSAALPVVVAAEILQEFLPEAARIANGWDIAPPDPDLGGMSPLDLNRYEIIREEEDDD